MAADILRLAAISSFSVKPFASIWFFRLVQWLGATPSPNFFIVSGERRRFSMR